MNTERFEDKIRWSRVESYEEHYSPYCDQVYYTSSQDPALQLAMRVEKPAVPGPILVMTHGWHQTIVPFEPWEEPGDSPYLVIQVDMRGRSFSMGQADCNGYELMDIYDAVQAARSRYADYISDPELVYFEAGSGGGGNAFALAGKFPDFFAAVNALYGISDYAEWYRCDYVGEFRDELDVWVGKDPDLDPMAYAARSGLTTVRNLLSPIFITHGALDPRVPVYHSRMFVEAAKAAGKTDLITYYEMEGVGMPKHISGATQDQLDTMRTLADRNLMLHSSPIELPRKGSLIVAGYVVTKHFKVFLDSLDKVARLNYDLDEDSFSLECSVPCEYRIEK
ncbi:MAG: prolyl oligopeptidase family serine peptidase [Firmicutes bacterium]|nr:prolyl oligopeptidase family serine peptidase [Bacillota bacterium]